MFLFDVLVSVLYRFILFCKIGKVKNIKIRGRLRIVSSVKKNIIIGSNVTLNSNNRKYHLNMHSPVKLMADTPNAIIIIGDNCRINGACIHAQNRIEIGKNCLIAANVQIMDSNGHELSFDNPENRINTRDIPKEVVIGDNVWVGANSFILPGVHIGYGSVIAANSVVTKDVPPMSLYGGSPARLIKKFDY